MQRNALLVRYSKMLNKSSAAAWELGGWGAEERWIYIIWSDNQNHISLCIRRLIQTARVRGVSLPAVVELRIPPNARTRAQLEAPRKVSREANALPEHTHMMRCALCKREYTETLVQHRAADEAPSVVYECPLCPLDVSRLHRKYSPSSSSHGVVQREVSSTHQTVSFKYMSSMQMMIASLSQHTYRGMRVSTGVSSRFTANVRCRDRNIRRGVCLGDAVYVHTKKSTLAPGCVLVSVDVYEANGGRAFSDEMCVYNVRLCGEDLCVYEKSNGSVFVEFVVCSDQEILGSVRKAYTLGACPSLLSAVVRSTFVSALFDGSSRAYDATESITTEESSLTDVLVYTHKIDGERMWMLRAGSVWLFCRRFMGSDVVYWMTCDRVSALEESTFLVLDVEFVVGRRPVLIDVLSTPNGVLRADHTQEEAMKAFCEVSFGRCPVFVREYFATLDQAKKSPSEYPCDGFVAIDVISRMTYKLKDTRSAELRYLSGGLHTEDGTRLMYNEDASKDTCLKACGYITSVMGISVKDLGGLAHAVSSQRVMTYMEDVLVIKGLEFRGALYGDRGLQVYPDLKSTQKALYVRVPFEGALQVEVRGLGADGCSEPWQAAQQESSDRRKIPVALPAKVLNNLIDDMRSSVADTDTVTAKTSSFDDPVELSWVLAKCYPTGGKFPVKITVGTKTTDFDLEGAFERNPDIKSFLCALQIRIDLKSSVAVEGSGKKTCDPACLTDWEVELVVDQVAVVKTSKTVCGGRVSKYGSAGNKDALHIQSDMSLLSL
ncbi:hypothetical protein JB92DRAFT_3269484 [Gautieria morchelliformis]|nr:hypothetical protein JB92DRAFT_3269484 [Gautieria morchelliformis]